MSSWSKNNEQILFQRRFQHYFQKLRKFRKKSNLSQEELAAQMQLLGADITQPLISKIELNQRFVKDYELVCFCPRSPISLKRNRSL